MLSANASMYLTNNTAWYMGVVKNFARMLRVHLPTSDMLPAGLHLVEVSGYTYTMYGSGMQLVQDT